MEFIKRPINRASLDPRVQAKNDGKTGTEEKVIRLTSAELEGVDYLVIVVDGEERATVRVVRP